MHTCSSLYLHSLHTWHVDTAWPLARANALSKANLSAPFTPPYLTVTYKTSSKASSEKSACPLPRVWNWWGAWWLRASLSPRAYKKKWNNNTLPTVHAVFWKSKDCTANECWNNVTRSKGLGKLHALASLLLIYHSRTGAKTSHASLSCHHLLPHLFSVDCSVPFCRKEVAAATASLQRWMSLRRARTGSCRPWSMSRSAMRRRASSMPGQ